MKEVTERSPPPPLTESSGQGTGCGHGPGERFLRQGRENSCCMSVEKDVVFGVRENNTCMYMYMYMYTHVHTFVGSCLATKILKAHISKLKW